MIAGEHDVDTPRVPPTLLLGIAATSIPSSMAANGFWEEIRKIPPVTRFLCGSSLAVSIPAMLKLVSPYHVVFVSDLVVQKLQVRPQLSKQRKYVNKSFSTALASLVDVFPRQ